MHHGPREFVETTCPHCGGKISIERDEYKSSPPMPSSKGAHLVTCMRTDGNPIIVPRCESTFYGVRCLLDPGHPGDHRGTRGPGWKERQEGA